MFLLDMPVALSEKLMKNRTGKTVDIHEADHAYLEICRDTARLAANLYDWTVISCAEQEEIRRIEDIHEELYKGVWGAIESAI